MPLNRITIPLLAAAATLLIAGSAAADVVPPPPKDCIDGATGKTGHVGPYCAPLSCAADADCKDGRVCREVPTCMTELVSHNRRRPDAPPSKYAAVVGPCDKTDGSACQRPPDSPKPRWGGANSGTCKAVKLCVRAPPKPPEPKPPEPPAKPDAGATKPTTEASAGSADKPTEPPKKEPAATPKKPAAPKSKPAAPESSSGCSTAPHGRNALLVAALLLLLGLARRR